MLELFHKLVRFRASLASFLRVIASKNVMYGGVRVVPGISLRKLLNLLRFTVHFVKFRYSENDIT